MKIVRAPGFTEIRALRALKAAVPARAAEDEKRSATAPTPAENQQ